MQCLVQIRSTDEVLKPSGVGHCFLNERLVVSSVKYKDRSYMLCYVIKLTPSIGQHNVDFIAHNFGLHYAFYQSLLLYNFFSLVCLISQV